MNTTVKFSVNWGARSRAFDGPGSALSMVLRITDAGVPSGDFLYAVNRDADPLAHTANYTSGPQAKSGTHTVTATFYADVNSTGDVVGTATGQMTLNKNGTLSGTISTTGTIASVQVVAGQSVGAGETKQLDVTTRDSGNGLIAVSPGSALWTVVSGSDKLTFENGYAKGLIVGSATVTATVDGITSASAAVSVSANPNISVSVDPQAAVVLPNETKQFSATVTGTSNQNVTWSVTTVGGGSIDGNGLYTAPGTIMYATVEARSVADPSKAGTALVTVQSATLTVTVTPNPASVSPNGTQQFSAVVDGSPDQNVTWSVVEAGGGSVSSSGLYTAPATEGTYTVEATSVADAAYSGSSNIQVMSMLAFTSRRDTDTFQIYSMLADGSHQTQITTKTGIDHSNGQSSWSPDGSKIVFWSNRDGTNNIYVMNADGSGQTRITNNGADNEEPDWSPDGTKIAFHSNLGGAYAIYVMNTDGSGLTKLGPGNNDSIPDWSPDGSKIAFVSFRDGNYEIYVMNSDGTGQTRITSTSEPEFHPAWSPDGTKIAFSRGFSGEVFVMNADGSNPANLTNHASDDHAPSWSRDGSKIAFYSSRTNSGDIYIMNADGSGVTQLTQASDGGGHDSPDWRP